MDLFRLDGKIALVTGLHGIGLRLRRTASSGSEITFNDLNQELIDRVETYEGGIPVKAMSAASPMKNSSGVVKQIEKDRARSTFS